MERLRVRARGGAGSGSGPFSAARASSAPRALAGGLPPRMPAGANPGPQPAEAEKRGESRAAAGGGRETRVKGPKYFFINLFVFIRHPLSVSLHCPAQPAGLDRGERAKDPRNLFIHSFKIICSFTLYSFKSVPKTPEICLFAHLEWFTVFLWPCAAGGPRPRKACQRKLFIRSFKIIYSLI